MKKSSRLHLFDSCLLNSYNLSSSSNYCKNSFEKFMKELYFTIENFLEKGKFCVNLPNGLENYPDSSIINNLNSYFDFKDNFKILVGKVYFHYFKYGLLSSESETLFGSIIMDALDCSFKNSQCGFDMFSKSYFLNPDKCIDNIKPYISSYFDIAEGSVFNDSLLNNTCTFINKKLLDLEFKNVIVRYNSFNCVIDVSFSW